MTATDYSEMNGDTMSSEVNVTPEEFDRIKRELAEDYVWAVYGDERPDYRDLVERDYREMDDECVWLEVRRRYGTDD